MTRRLETPRMTPRLEHIKETIASFHYFCISIQLPDSIKQHNKTEKQAKQFFKVYIIYDKNL